MKNNMEHNKNNPDCHYECKGLCNAAMPFCVCHWHKVNKENFENFIQKEIEKTTAE